MDPKIRRDSDPRWLTQPISRWTVQCAKCLKWRLVPNEKDYEAIRENFTNGMWRCDHAFIWGSSAHCEDPGDLDVDCDKVLWAMDTPGLPYTPPGWKREISVRADRKDRIFGSNTFADVYYRAPNGKRQRSMADVRKYIENNPEIVPDGSTTAQFSRSFSFSLPQAWEGVGILPIRKKKRS